MKKMANISTTAMFGTPENADANAWAHAILTSGVLNTGGGIVLLPSRGSVSSPPTVSSVERAHSEPPQGRVSNAMTIVAVGAWSKLSDIFPLQWRHSSVVIVSMETPGRVAR